MKNDNKFLGITNERLEQQLSFLVEVDKLKHILRKTLLIDGSRPENDSEHSWHLALMAMLLKEHAIDTSFDLERVMKMVIIHDLVEIYAGDTFAYDVKGYETKAQNEQKAADKLFSQLPDDQAKEIRTLWEEFDKEESSDARYAAALDHMQPFIHNVFTGFHTWKIATVTKEQVLKRMKISCEVLPGIKDWVESKVEEACKKGYLK